MDEGVVIAPSNHPLGRSDDERGVLVLSVIGNHGRGSGRILEANIEEAGRKVTWAGP